MNLSDKLWPWRMGRRPVKIKIVLSFTVESFLRLFISNTWTALFIKELNLVWSNWLCIWLVSKDFLESFSTDLCLFVVCHVYASSHMFLLQKCLLKLSSCSVIRVRTSVSPVWKITLTTVFIRSSWAPDWKQNASGQCSNIIWVSRLHSDGLICVQLRFIVNVMMELGVSLKSGEFLDMVSDCQLLKDSFVMLNLLLIFRLCKFWI